MLDNQFCWGHDEWKVSVRYEEDKEEEREGAAGSRWKGGEEVSRWGLTTETQQESISGRREYGGADRWKLRGGGGGGGGGTRQLKDTKGSKQELKLRQQKHSGWSAIHRFLAMFFDQTLYTCVTCVYQMSTYFWPHALLCTWLSGPPETTAPHPPRQNILNVFLAADTTHTDNRSGVKVIQKQFIQSYNHTIIKSYNHTIIKSHNHKIIQS